MGYFAALAITLFLAAFVLITVINGGVQMVIYFPIYSSPEGEQMLERMGQKIRSEPWHTTLQNQTKAR